MTHYDVAIVGSGYAGATLGWILAAQGRSVLLIDRAAHPRFAIGESSTPLADLILDRLADRYGLPGLGSLARYGRWKRDLSQLECGLKRGFSYFQHASGRPYHDTADHRRSLLVTASADTTLADTHWLRADVDHYLTQGASAAGADLCEHTHVQSAVWDQHWRIKLRDATATASAATKNVTAGFLVDATGSSGFANRFLGTRDVTARLQTRTAAVYGHFDGVGSWSQALKQQGFGTADDPFDADHAAQHHLLEDGWVWMLRFDGGRTSVGRVFASDAAPRPCPWRAIADRDTAPGEPAVDALGLRAYPSLAAVLEDARHVAPGSGVVCQPRLQQAQTPVVGPAWALLPTAAATIDPLHSTGIAHGLWGVEQLAGILLDSPAGSPRRLARYAEMLEREIDWLDRIVAVSYANLGCFSRFAISTMLYFIAAIDCEERYGAGESVSALWSVDRPELMAAIDDCTAWLQPPGGSLEQLARRVRARLQPWNTAGLLDASAKNRYRYTAAPK
ncbi:NAD(P)/FAD-dependent oxidoreductase [Roseimaritima sediminicola]|uniref:NAD(P)/FAD-dependent oxidoreductase n=1 Tax=Roseimaritima sediminicola TaxID=2662066 RepID=UPI001298354A|nr:FAD-dependent oxidoreductase [Roseimaritima sediminicola]